MSASERKIEALQRKIEVLERELEAARDEVHKLRHLLKGQMRQGESFEIEAIVNDDGVPLVNLRWDDLTAQLPVARAREIMLEGLRVCEWAEVDASMFKALTDAGFSDREVGGFMAMMREARGGDRERAAKT